jgi:hypothetical protein
MVLHCTTKGFAYQYIAGIGCVIQVLLIKFPINIKGIKVCKMKKLLRLLVVVYSSIGLIGCTTQKAIEYIESTAETVTHHWNVEGIEFAAIEDNRYVRMCIILSSQTDTKTEELTIDLQQISNTLNNQTAVIEGLEAGLSDESPFCSRYLEAGENSVPISEIHSDAPDITEALYAIYPEPLDQPVITLLQHDTGRYLVFGAPMDMYGGLDEHAFGSYTQTEQRFSPAVVLLIPLALIVDAALITAMVILLITCVIPFLLPLCIPIAIAANGIQAASSDVESDPDPEPEDLFDDY